MTIGCHIRSLFLNAENHTPLHPTKHLDRINAHLINSSGFKLGRYGQEIFGKNYFRHLQKYRPWKKSFLLNDLLLWVMIQTMKCTPQSVPMKQLHANQARCSPVNYKGLCLNVSPYTICFRQQYALSDTNLVLNKWWNSEDDKTKAI